MSGRINDINTVIPAKTGVAFKAKNGVISSLLDGQVGIFDAATQTSVDATSTSLSAIKEFTVVRGVGTPSGGIVPDIRKSAGIGIQTRNIQGYTYQSYSASRNKIVKIDPGTSANCEKDFLIKVEFQNGQIYRTQGFNAFTKIFSVRTSCCDDCFTCFSGDTNEVTSLMVQAINADKDGLLLAVAVMKQNVLITDVAAGGVLSRNYVAGDEIAVYADLLVLAKFNRTVDTIAERFYSYINIESQTTAVANYLGINLNYFLTRQTDIKVVYADGFSCDKDITTSQEMAYEMGSGYDLGEREYEASGHQASGPYRVSSITGLANKDLVRLVDGAARYDVIQLHYANSSFSENREYAPMGQRVTVAFPVADTTARNAFIATLDAIVAGQGFSPLTDDVTASVSGASGVEAQPASTAVDGISE
jgi:hypothetical protein